MGASVWIQLNLLRWLPNVVSLEQYVQLLYGAAALPFAYAVAGLYPGYGLHPVERLRKRTLATTLVFVVLIFWEFLVRREASSLGILLLTYAFALLFVPVGDAILRSFLRKVNLWGTPVVLIGTNAARVPLVPRYSAEFGNFKSSATCPFVLFLRTRHRSFGTSSPACIRRSSPTFPKSGKKCGRSCLPSAMGGSFW